MGNIEKTNAEWQEVLTPEQFQICRIGGTEPPGSGALLHNKAVGRYDCICCGHPLFESDNKYDSGSGWPSFWRSINESDITKLIDKTHGMTRTELRCRHCQSHLGHLFTDGPAPTGLRFCVNSASLKFIPYIEDEE